MKQATIAIAADLDTALSAYGRDLGVDSELDALIVAALRDLLTGRGYLVPFRPFQITPIEHEGDETDVSLNHDRYFVDGETRAVSTDQRITECC